MLHTRVDERKDALGNLFNTSDVAADIDNCRAVAARITKLAGDQSRKAKENDLEAECTALREMVQAGLGSVSYKKLSTIDQGLAGTAKIHLQFMIKMLTLIIRRRFAN